MQRGAKRDLLPRIAALALFAGCLWNTAWLADDAFITLRTVDNWLAGYGPRWNVIERVQTYTHPLWMLVTTATCGLTGEYVVSVMAQSALISLAAVAVIAVRVARTTTAAVLAVAALALSSAFVDYSTSGLENPLTHLLLAAFASVVLVGARDDPRRLLRLGLIASLVAVNRLDAVLMCAPVVALEFWRERSPAAVRALLIGALPLAAWELCSVTYYGFAFPNTAYAKLGAGVPTGELVERGFAYLGQSLSADPLTLVVIAAGLATALIERAHRPLAAGVVLYLAYVVSIGGDFMAGRFLTAPLLVAVALLSRLPFAFPARGTLAAAAVLVLGSLAADRASFASVSGVEATAEIPAHGIADERFQYPETSLVRTGLAGQIESAAVRDGQRARAAGVGVVALHAVGLAGFSAGPEVHVLDRAGLCDPLLARLPAKYDPAWRTGHFWRALPEGYAESLPDGPLVLADAALVELAEALRLATRAPLFDAGRLRAVWALHAGALEGAVDRDRYRHPLLTRFELDAGSTRWTAAPALELPAAVVELGGASTWNAPELEFATRQARAVRVVLYRGDEVVLDGRPRETAREGGRREYTLEVPASVARAGYDRVRVFPAARRDPARPRAAWLETVGGFASR